MQLERSHSWPSALAWKASMVQAIEGSNPSLSAIKEPEQIGFFLFNSLKRPVSLNKDIP